MQCNELTELSKPVCHEWVIGMLTEIAQTLRKEESDQRICALQKILKISEKGPREKNLGVLSCLDAPELCPAPECLHVLAPPHCLGRARRESHRPLDHFFYPWPCRAFPSLPQPVCLFASLFNSFITLS